MGTLSSARAAVCFSGELLCLRAYLLLAASMFVSASADRQKRLIFLMTYYLSNRALNSVDSLTFCACVLCFSMVCCFSVEMIIRTCRCSVSVVIVTSGVQFRSGTGAPFIKHGWQVAVSQTSGWKRSCLYVVFVVHFALKMFSVIFRNCKMFAYAL